MKKLKEHGAIRKIRSMDELKQEKMRLRRELQYSTEKIEDDYHSLLDAFTFRNLLQLATEELTRTSNVFAQALEIGRSFFKRKKKKKRARRAESVSETDLLQPEDQD